MEMPPATGVGLVFIGRIHTPWTSRMETPACSVDRSWISLPATALSGAIGLAALDVRGHSSLAAVEPREKGSRVLLIECRRPSGPATIGIEHGSPNDAFLVPRPVH